MSKLNLEVSVFYLPDKNTDVVLRVAIRRDRRNACAHCYVTVDLDEARAQQVVTTRGLVCITLLYISRQINNAKRSKPFLYIYL